MSSFRGFYLNLDKNPARAAQMARQLREVGLADKYQRLPAVDGYALGAEYVTKLDRGNLGLWLSHEKLLAANESSSDHLHILEDDALLPADAAVFFKRLVDAMDAEPGGWDLIYTDFLPSLDVSTFQMISEFWEGFKRSGQFGKIPLKNLSFSCATSFFINHKSIRKWQNLMKGRWVEGLPIDLFLRKCVKEGALNGFVTLPFATSISEISVESNIRGGLDLSRRMMDLYRVALFKDSDCKAVAAKMRGLAGGAKVSPLSECYLETLKFILSDQFVRF